MRYFPRNQVSTSEPEAKATDSMEVDKVASTAPDSSEDNHLLPEQSVAAAPAASNGPDCNGEVTESKQAVGEDGDITSSNGSATPVKGKAKGKSE